MPRAMRERAWAASGAVSVALFLLGLLFGDLVGSVNFPPLDAGPARVRAYFVGNASEVRALAFFHTLSALALLVFAAYLGRWLRRQGRDGAAAVAGGATAAAFLLGSALCYRALAESPVARDAPLAHALLVLSYLAGGPAITVPLALAIAVTSAALAPRGGAARALAALGAVAAAVCVAAAVTLLGPMNNSSAAYGVLLIGAVLGFGWMFALSVWLAVRDPLADRS